MVSLEGFTDMGEIIEDGRITKFIHDVHIPIVSTHQQVQFFRFVQQLLRKQLLLLLWLLLLLVWWW